ncbi:TonB-dependent receptor plug domain-containing protein [Verrucomicrobium sp. GAS474]|uniref:TonB-dependent receptor n=1 Tax=Verrucomicrobium sp. GAS474 TaxID=1882831 RepID=UPI00138FB88C|nr:TonB-dependent receptor plug domain-containing protein [Verrucomicrobium sp. GAS474]
MISLPTPLRARWIGGTLLSFLSFADCDLGRAEDHVSSVEPVIVTAQAPAAGESTDAGAHATPLSDTRLDRREFDTFQIRSLTDLDAIAPNLVTHSGGNRELNSISGMRGMMNSLSFTDPAIVYYVDDVPASTPIFNTLDPYSLQSLRLRPGSQAGFYGQNSPGGVIEMTQSQPKPVFSSRFSTEYGTYGSRAAFGEFTEGIKGTDLSLLVSGHYTSQEGYLTNPVLNTHPDKREEFSGRIALRWTPTKEWTVDLNVTQADDNDGIQRFTPLSAPHDLIPDRVDGHTDLQKGLQSVRSRYDGDDVVVTFVSSHRSADLDPSFLDLGFGGSSTLSTARTHEQQYTQELRIASKDADKEPFSWSGGLFTQHIDFAASADTVTSTTTAHTLIHADYDTYAAFGAVTVRPSEPFSLTFSNRFQGDDKGGDRADALYFGTTPLSASTDRERHMWLNVAPKLEGEYKVDDQTTVFSSTALAFRPGGYAPFPSQANMKPYASERTWANEIGARYEGWGHRLKTRATLFWNETYAYQLERNNYPNSDVDNAPEVASRGAEYDLSVEPVDGLVFHGSAGYTLSTFVHNRDSATGIDISGYNVPYVPRTTYLLEGTYRHPCGWMTHADVRGLGQTDYSALNQLQYRQNAYGIVGTKLGYESPSDCWSVYVYGENLANARYSVLIDSGLNAQISGAPRTYGVAANVKW